MNKPQSNMEIEQAPIGSITRYPGNPRRNQHAVPSVKASIDAFGWLQPIVVDADRVIIVGDTRYQAAIARKDKTVPVLVAKNLTPAQVAAYRLADNRVGEISEWDETKLFKELQDIMESGEPFDLLAMGFTEEEVSAAIPQPKKEDLRYLEDFEVVPEPKPKWILISAPEDKCPEIIAAVNNLGIKKGFRMEYSGDNA